MSTLPTMSGLPKLGKLKMPKMQVKKSLSIKGLMRAKLVSFHKQGLLKSPGSPLGRSGKFSDLTSSKGWGIKV